MPAAGCVEDLIAAVGEAGGTIRRDDNAIELAAPAPLPPDLVGRIRDAKPLLLVALAEAADWRARHREALAHWGALRATDEAAWLAWSELQCGWHRRHGAGAPEWECAGCGGLIGGRNALELGDDNRVHLDDEHGLNCVIAYGALWRARATSALVALGLQPPTEPSAP